MNLLRHILKNISNWLRLFPIAVFFRRYFGGGDVQSGTPEVSAKGEYDADAKTYKLTLKQSSKKESDLPFHIPVVVGLLLKETGSEVRAVIHCCFLERGYLPHYILDCFLCCVLGTMSPVFGFLMNEALLNIMF